jgi:hypothetical protein
MIAVGLQRPLAQNAPPATRPRTRARIEASFGVHTDELFFQRKLLRFRGLGRIHDDGKW